MKQQQKTTKDNKRQQKTTKDKDVNIHFGESNGSRGHPPSFVPTDTRST